jgi:hypothetical protein
MISKEEKEKRILQRCEILGYVFRGWKDENKTNSNDYIILFCIIHNIEFKIRY